MIAITTDKVAVSYLGGDALVMTSAAWPAGLLTVTATVNGTAYPCVTGRPGSMQSSYALGSKLTVYMPQMPASTTVANVSVTDVSNNVVGTLTVPVTVPFYASCTFDLRDLLPTNWARGSLSIADVPLLGY